MTVDTCCELLSACQWCHTDRLSQKPPTRHCGGPQPEAQAGRWTWKGPTKTSKNARRLALAGGFARVTRHCANGTRNCVATVPGPATHRTPWHPQRSSQIREGAIDASRLTQLAPPGRAGPAAGRQTRKTGGPALAGVKGIMVAVGQPDGRARVDDIIMAGSDNIT